MHNIFDMSAMDTRDKAKLYKVVTFMIFIAFVFFMLYSWKYIMALVKLLPV